MFYKLESARGIAACMIVLHHSRYFLYEDQTRFVENAYLFVDFFFILSGFVMAYAYSEKINNGIPFVSFIALRLGRIYPLHLFMTLILLAYFSIKVAVGLGTEIGLYNDTVQTFISNILLVQALGIHDSLSWNQPAWSISVEFYSYIAFFLLSITLDKKNGLLIPLLISFSAYAFLFSQQQKDFQFTYDYGFIRCLGAFYLGVFLLRIKPVIDKINIEINLSEIISVVLIVTAVTFSNTYYWAPLFPILAFAASVLVFSNARNGLLGKLLTTRLFLNIGLWSYSIYLTHELIQRMLQNVVIRLVSGTPTAETALILNIVFLVSVIVISRFSYIHIEKRFRDYVKKRINKQSKDTLQAATETGQS